MFKVSTTIFLKDQKLSDKYYDEKYNKKSHRIDLRKVADFTNETPEQPVDNNFAPPAPPAPSTQSTDCTVQQNNNQQQQQDLNNPNAQQQQTTAKAEPFSSVGTENAKTMHQNGLIGNMAPTSDYWEDNSSESYTPHSDWNSPSSAIWSPAAINLYGRY